MVPPIRQQLSNVGQLTVEPEQAISDDLNTFKTQSHFSCGSTVPPIHQQVSNVRKMLAAPGSTVPLIHQKVSNAIKVAVSRQG